MFFKVFKKDTRSNARLGIISTKNGDVLTPSYTIVGTHAEVRCIPYKELVSTKTQMIISNTYHLWRTLGEKINHFEGLHKKINFKGVIMTDSGGFQVFSLGFAREHGVGKIAPIFPEESNSFASVKQQKNLVRITDDGAYFTDDGKEYFLNPEISIGIQEKLGADIILAFDECTSPLHNEAYTKNAMNRTHRWAKRCIDAKTKNNDQYLYGIVQGGSFEKLRKESAAFIGSLPFDGFAIGGSLGNSRNEMFDVVDWSIPYLDESKPRHLLGIGKIEDLFECIERGIDTFDCVIPTREARHGGLWTHNGRFDIKKGKYASDEGLIEDRCKCPVCSKGITRKTLRELFKSKNPEAGHLATLHNVYFFNNMMEQIRKSIKDDVFLEFKKEFLKNINKNT